MEYRRLTEQDLPSLLELYKQLQPEDEILSAEKTEAVWQEIENVVTDKDYRNRGLASSVIDMAISYAKEKNCYKVILQSGITRVDAHRFYESKGFDGNSKKAFDMRLSR